MKWFRIFFTKLNEQAGIVTVLAGVVAALFGLYFGPAIATVIGAIVAIIVFVCLQLIQRQRDLVPEPKDLLFSNDFSVRVASPALLEEAIQIGRRAFPRFNLSSDVVRQLSLIDSSFVRVAVDEASGQVIGYIDCYALRDTQFTKDFIAGKADEDDFDLGSVVPLVNIAKCHCLYVAGLVIEEENRQRRGRITKALITDAMESLLSILKNENTKISAISVAYTNHGRKLLEAFGFAFCKLCGHRKDGGHFYVAELSRRRLRQAIRKLEQGDHRESFLVVDQGTAITARLLPTA